MSTATSSVCVFCKGTSYTYLYDTTDIFDNKFNIHQCHTCRAVYLSPFPTPEQFQQAYSDDYYGEQEEKFSPVIERVVDFFRAKRAKHIFSRIGKQGVVLDIGCGNGKFLSYLSKKGDYTLHGVELDKKSAQRASLIPGLHLKVGVLAAGDFPSHSVDAITLFHVFEHLPNPKETLSIIRDILSPTGVLVMSFPNIDSWQSRFFKGHWLHLDPPRHLFFFAPSDFKSLMNFLGFTCIHERYISTEQNPFGLVQSILNKWTRKRELLFEALKGNTTYLADTSKSTVFLHKLFFLCAFPLFVGTDVVASYFKKGATVEFTFIKK